MATRITEAAPEVEIPRPAFWCPYTVAESCSRGRRLITGRFPGNKWQTWIVTRDKEGKEVAVQRGSDHRDEDAAFWAHVKDTPAALSIDA